MFNDSETLEAWQARNERLKAKNINGNGMGMSIAMAAKIWPTPNATDGDKAPKCFSRGDANPSLPQAARTWSTPRASDGEKGGPNQSFGAGGVPLVTQATSWSTPSVADTTGGRKARSGDRSGEMLNNSLAPLVADIATWPTPTSLSFADSHQPGNSRSHNRTLELARDLRFDRLAPATLMRGASSPSSSPSFYQRYRATTDSALRCEMRALRRIARDRRHIAKFKKVDGKWERVLPGGSPSIRVSPFLRPSFRRQLNAAFVEWLMSWPPGLTSFACSETALRTHKAAWRSELASMTSLPAAPPAQLSLFG